MKTDSTPPQNSNGTDPLERAIDGVGVSPGIAIGPAHVVENRLGDVPEYQIPTSSVKTEVARLRSAVAKARRQVEKLEAKATSLPKAIAEDLVLMLEAHAGMLTSSRIVGAAEKRIEERRINAEAAIQAVVHEVARTMAAVEDEYIASRVQDVREAGARIVRHLTEKPYQAFSKLPEGAIVIADELSPADTALMDPEKVSAFVTAVGGPESHTAIMARSLGIPAVLGAPSAPRSIASGATVIVDGEAGRIVVDPEPHTIADYKRKVEARDRLERQLARLRTLPAQTKDSTHIVLHANLELPREVEAADRAGAEGVGLLRTEFMFMNRVTLPTEDEQYETLREIVEGMAGRPVTIRTLDVGGEKLATALGDKIATSANPALGLRAIRFSLLEPKLFETQLAAILRAAAHGPVRILLPMISSVQQVRVVRKILNKVISRLKRRKVPLPETPPPLGVMIEVPGAALVADALAQASDFFAIGTNDLTMYTLAIDRGAEQVAGLYNPLHPAVLRLIQATVASARRNDIPVSICGEMAGEPRYAPVLLGMGVRELSMSARSIPRVKQRIRNIDVAPAARRAEAILDQSDEGRIAALLDDFNEGL